MKYIYQLFVYFFPASAASTATTTASASEMEDVDAIKSAADVLVPHQQHQQRPSVSGFSSSGSAGPSPLSAAQMSPPPSGPATSSTIPNSISSSSFAQVKHSFKTAIGASPPPPYEVIFFKLKKYSFKYYRKY